MTYSTGGSGYPPAQQHGPYAPTTQFSKAEEGPSKLPVYLLAAVVVLGLAGYLVSFGPVWKSSEIGTMGGSTITGGSFEIVALVLAALLAAAALLPKARNYTAIVAVVAVVGFLLAISELITKPSFLSVGWALIVIVVLAGLQAVAAVGALLLEAGVITPPAPRPKYDQYPQYGGYYGQPGQGHQQHTPPSQPQQNLGQRPAYPQYGGYPPATGGFPPGGGPQSGPPTPPTGFPTYAQPPSQGSGQVPGQEYGAHEQAPTQQVPVQQHPQSSASSPSGPPPS
ncbi:MAG: DUF5336 domain-containing protein [Mycobacteriaceae bacterium]|nr:DUF5336 domain-containing protein [Mycobacteriaceae bacterium]MBV9640104.1 DUF5336 domain-containing protein [Mycobacteriaceae bacterium]